MSELKINKDNFQKEVLNETRPVLLDFYADWCGPCRMVGPVVAKLAEEHPEIKVGKINVEEAKELAGEFNVMSIPTFVVMKNGEVVGTSVGAKSKEQLLKLVQG